MRFFDNDLDNVRMNTSMEELLRNKLRDAQGYIDEMNAQVTKQYPMLNKASDLSDLYKLSKIIERAGLEPMDHAKMNNFIFDCLTICQRINREG